MSITDHSRSLVDKPSNTIMLVGEITLEQASFFRRQFKSLERSRRVTTIIVEINSQGGDIEAGFLIMDTIELSKKTVITRVAGIAMSMGASILACGHRREALPTSSVMIHQGSYSIRGQANQLRGEYDECVRIEKLCYDKLDKQTKQKKGYWEKRVGNANLYLTAEQALESNLVQKILAPPKALYKRKIVRAAKKRKKKVSKRKRK